MTVGRAARTQPQPKPRPLRGRLAGLSPGGHAQASVYFAEPLGIALQANVDWIGGRSRVLSSGVAAMVVAGPVFRWRSP